MSFGLAAPRVRVETGLDRLAAADASVVRLVRGRRIGLLAHAASVDARLRPAHTLLAASGAKLEVLFGPEHGFDGRAQDMIPVEGGATEGHVLRSLYGSSEAELSPRPEWLDGLEAVVVDLQDVGSRYYTYVWTAALMLRATARAGIGLIVLDRPNPLGGEIVEGRPQRAGYRSFVGLYDLPVRHGLTIGEILTRVAREEALDPQALEVVRMRGWRRSMHFDETGLPWVLPSPNMPTLETALVYPGGCLIEGTALSEGRGTTRPFELWGAPWLDGDRLAAEVELDGARLRPVRFRPAFHKYAGEACGGVQVHVSDRRAFRAQAAYLRLLEAALRQAPNGVDPWRREPYEFVSDRLAFDLLMGGPEAREALETRSGLEAILEAEAEGARAFAATSRELHLYDADAP